MTQTAPQSRGSLVWWLTLPGVLAVAAIGILWAIPRPTQACIMIYPPPPECSAGGDASRVVPFLVVIVLLYAAIVTSAVLLRSERRPVVLGLLTGAIGLTLIVGLAVTLNATGSGIVY